MDVISNEARVGAFAIGPSTALGRALALRVLFFGSLARLRRRLAAALLAAAPVAAAWLHPRHNTRGILLAVCAVALLLQGRGGRAGVRARVQSAYRRKFWRNMMRAALTYEEWAHAARMLERETPRNRRRPLRRGARAQQAPRAQAPSSGGLAQGHRLLHACRPAEEPW